MDLTPSPETWRIDDTLFYPLGLINHTTGSKTVFVTWSDKYLMNFVFKKVAENANRCNRFIIRVHEEIVDIVILEVNTLVLLKNGEVCYFSSIKSIHRIPWLNSGVRCVSASLNGFSLIRVLEDRRISLQLYADVLNVGKSPQEPVRTFDLTFDERNLFDSDWRDETFTMASLEVTAGNRQFLELLVGETGLQAMEVHIFSVSSNLFALFTSGDDDYEIKSLPPQASPVESIKFLVESNMLLIFLSCGVIEVWYLSRIAPIVEKYTYINGSEFIHHTFAGDVLYFTDEQRVCRLKFTYDSVEHVCRVVENCIDAPGMVAITYEEVSGLLVCLSNNNIFYHLSFSDDPHEEDSATENCELFELTDERVQEMLTESHILEEVHSLPEKIEKQIEEEYKKQELIAVCRKSNIYSELISAEVSFSQHIPETEERLIFSTDCGIPPFTYFAVVSLKIVSHEIFRTTVWNLMIAHSSHVRLLSITPDLLREKFSVLIPILRSPSDLLPEFEIQMLTHVNVEQDFVCINIPVKVGDVEVKKLFSRNQGLRKLTRESGESFTYKVVVTQFDTNDMCHVFGLSVPKESGEDTIQIDDIAQTLYFLGEKVSVFYSESTSEITVETYDPVALYYAKMCILKHCYRDGPGAEDGCEELRRTLLELQCQVERKYGALADNELHFKSLKSVYERLRKEVVWKF